MRQIASVDTVVASRFHNVLCALMLAKPTLSVGYAAKFGALMEEVGLAEFCQSAHSVDVDRLIEQFTELESRSTQVQQMIMERTAANVRLLTTNSLRCPRCSSGQPNRRRPRPDTSILAQILSREKFYEQPGRRRRLRF